VHETAWFLVVLWLKGVLCFSSCGLDLIDFVWKNAHDAAPRLKNCGSLWSLLEDELEKKARDETVAL
jgi:hypothetical protein